MSKMERGFGFDPDVCESCVHHTYYNGDGSEAGMIERIGNLITKENGYWGCGLCGCPTAEGYPMDRFGMPPEGCPHLDEHEGQ